LEGWEVFEDQTCLITGGTGSWGRELTRRLLLQKPREIRIFSRNEFAQVEMQRSFPKAENLRFMIGDVRDQYAVREACAGADYVFHLAALKHVPICEAQPEEALKTNVLGTQNIIRASIASRVKKVIDVSTDKAVNPVNFYGLSKSLGEKLILQADDKSPYTRFVCIRGGNVLGTNGSVVPLFYKQILERHEVTITSKEMTRFFLTIPDAIELLLVAAKTAIGGETFVMQMKTCRILDLARVMGEHLTEHPVTYREVGIRPGEKLHEVLVSSYEAPHTYPYEERYYVILPTSRLTSQIYNRYQTVQPVAFDSYTSNQNPMSKTEIAGLLKKGGLLP
jgi:UDP-N-acetylglucosamine 4,6-dehydratase/5-epimerase